MTGAARRVRAIAILAFAVAACVPAMDPGPARPAVPPAWSVVSADTGDLRLSLPPYLRAFDTSGAIFASEPDGAGGVAMEVVAEGPRTAEPQPAPDESLVTWLARRPLSGEPERFASTTQRVLLPAGDGIELRTVMAPGTPGARAVVMYAVRTRSGVATLVIDGPPAAMKERAADILLIAALMELGVGP